MLFTGLYYGDGTVHVAQRTEEHRFKAHAGMLAVVEMVLAVDIDHVAGVYHDAGHGSGALHFDARLRRIQSAGVLEVCGKIGEDKFVVDTAAHGFERRITAVEYLAEHALFIEIRPFEERRGFFRQLVEGTGHGAAQSMAADVAGAMAVKVKVAVVGGIDDGAAVGAHAVVYRKPGVIERVGDDCGDLAGVALLAVGTDIAETYLMLAEDLAIPFHAAEALDSAVHVHTVDIVERVVPALKMQSAVRHAADKTTKRRAEEGGIGFVFRGCVITEDDVAQSAEAIGDPEPLNAGADLYQGDHASGAGAYYKLFYISAVGGAAEYSGFN